MFGGFGGGDTDTIAQFDPLLLKWAQVGQLARKRHSANAIEGLLLYDFISVNLFDKACMVIF